MNIKTNTFKGGNTLFKPYMLPVVSGNKVYNKKNICLNLLVGVVCLVTPFTNWLIFVTLKAYKISEVKF